MFLDGKTQYCKYVDLPQVNLLIQCNCTESQKHNTLWKLILKLF